MATKTLITPEEYLHTSYPDGDREYVDGEVRERNLGQYRHWKIQYRLLTRLSDLSKRHPLFICIDVRMKVSETRYRLPDLAAFAGQEPSEEVPSIPPLMVMEVVSPDDRHSSIIEKLDEYLLWGVKHVWLADPWTQKLHTYSKAGLMEVPAFRLPEYNFEMTAAEILA